MRCLIVDDEKPARLEMRQLLGTHAGVEVTGEAATVDEAVALTQANRLDVVFLDVKLRGETGFDYLERCSAPRPHIIFVTAHDAHAVRGFECNALDYLLKPVNPRRLTEALKRVRERLAAARPPEAEESAFVKVGNSLRLLRWREVERIVSNGNYTDVYLDNGEMLTVLRPLKRWLELAPTRALMQVHRAVLVRPGAIASIRFLEGQKREILLRGGTVAPVGREFASTVRATIARI